MISKITAEFGRALYNMYNTKKIVSWQSVQDMI
jgi:hypothetical protein